MSASPGGRRRSGSREDFRAVWEESGRAERTLGLDPGVREAWHGGRERYAVWLLRVSDPAALARMVLVREALARALGPRFLPVPEHNAHITVFVAGFPRDSGAGSGAPERDDDVAPARLAAQAERVRAARLDRLRLGLGGANAFLSCPFLQVYDPLGGLARLRALLDRDARELRFGPYRPHLTLGSLPEAVPMASLQAALTPWRGGRTTPLIFDALELAVFDPRVAGAPLITVERVALGANLSERSRWRAGRRRAGPSWSR